MIKNERTNPKQSSMISSVTLGVLGAFILFLLIGVLISWLIVEGVLSESRHKIPSAVGIGFSAFIGTIMASIRAKGKYAIVGLITALCLLLILFMCNILFFEGSFQNALPIIAAVTVGGVAGILICLKIGSKNTKNKKGPLVKLYKKSRR